MIYCWGWRHNFDDRWSWKRYAKCKEIKEYMLMSLDFRIHHFMMMIWKKKCYFSCTHQIRNNFVERNFFLSLLLYFHTMFVWLFNTKYVSKLIVLVVVFIPFSDLRNHTRLYSNFHMLYVCLKISFFHFNWCKIHKNRHYIS